MATGTNKAQAPWPADKPERRDIKTLIPYARNARLHSPDQVRQIAASMKEWGWTNPVLIDEEGTIIAGHGRVMAAEKLGWGEIPCIIADGWTEAQKKAYVIADNKLAENASWDFETLKIELSDLSEIDFDLSLIGFETKELNDLLAEEEGGLTDPDEIPEKPVEPVSVTGDLWVLGSHRLLCGDSTSADDVSKLLGSVKPHLMVTDPPYGVNYDPGWRHRVGINNSKRLGKVQNDDRADWREAWALFPGDIAYVWHGGLHAAAVAESLEASGFHIRAQIVWAKDRLVMGRGDYHWQHEPCWYAVRKNARGQWAGDRKQTTLWNIPNKDQDTETAHGTQKPVECMKRPIENNSSVGQAVYEPFDGSGTTVIAAEMIGRHCFAMELDPAYVDMAITRWQNFTGQDAVHEPSGRSFKEMAAERLGG